jgi:predicted oxidoreductase
MQTTLLGRSSVASTRLVYGGWRIAGTQDPKAVSAEARKNGIRAVQAAYEAGFTGFDLADVYCDGMCEEIFGAALRETPGMRSRIMLATKCGIRVPGPESPYRYDFSKDYIVSAVEMALRRLGVEQIDLLMLHRPDFLMDPAEVAGAFGELRTSGKVREFGVSNFRPSQVTALQRACPFPLAVNQVEISLRRLDAFQDGTLDQCLAEKITPMAWSPLGGAGLTAFSPALQTALAKAASGYGVSAEALALTWLLKHPAGIMPVIGTTRPERIQDLAVADRISLSREEWYSLLQTAMGERLP